MGRCKKNGPVSVARIAIQQDGIFASPKTGTAAQLSDFVPFSDTQRFGTPTISEFSAMNRIES
jgi:hypothetical protein